MTTEDLLSDTNTSNVLDQLVGEGKKFKTQEDLARGKIESDTFIQRLQSEMTELRKDLNERVRMEELLERLETARSNDGTNSNESNQLSGDRPNSPDLETIIEQKLSKREQQKTAKENVAEVRKALEKHFGEDYEAKLKAKAEELQLTVAELNDWAKKSPKAFLELVGVREQRGGMYTPPTSRTFSSDRMGGNTGSGGTKTYSQYEALRKSNPTEYWSATTQLQMHKDAIAAANNGEDFYK